MSNSVNKPIQFFTSLNMVNKLIAINVASFILTYLINTLGFLFSFKGNIWFNLFAMPANPEIFLFRPWTIVSYGFLHAGFFHILGNLIVLYYIGNLFTEYFNEKLLLYFYIIGTLFGGLIYMTAYNFFPVFQNDQSILVGASSAVMAIFIGIATHIPYYSIHLRFIGPVKLWVLAVIFLALDIIQIPNGNAGGHLAHLGGAFFGFIYVKQILQPQNSKTRKRKKETFKEKIPIKKVFKNNNANRQSSSFNDQVANQQRIDAILDKIGRSGYDALSKEEKEFLFKQGKS